MKIPPGRVTRHSERLGLPIGRSLWIADDSLGDYENAFSGPSVSRT